jgi:imidazoleglycerol phosphate synthase glutamine amidotransferase subunit HisH
LGKTFPKSDNVQVVYDAQNLSSQKYEVFGEVFVFFVHSFSVQPDEIEGAVVAEALGRGADAVIVQDLSFGYSFTTSVRRRLIKFK